MARASRSKRSLNGPRLVLMATNRFRRVSRAFQTSPMPPAPRWERISYGPSRVPGARAMEGAQEYRVPRFRQIESYSRQPSLPRLVTNTLERAAANASRLPFRKSTRGYPLTDRFRRAMFRGPAIHDRDGAEAQCHPVPQQARADDGLAVHERAVLASQIDDRRVLSVDRDGGMLPGDGAGS